MSPIRRQRRAEALVVRKAYKRELKSLMAATLPCPSFE